MIGCYPYWYWINPCVAIPSGQGPVPEWTRDSNFEYISADAIPAMIQIQPPLLQGSIICDMRIKVRAVKSGDGIRVKVMRRDEDTIATPYTQVGDTLSWDASSDMTEPALIDFELVPVTIEAGYSYVIQIINYGEAGIVYLYALGIQTARRIL